MSDKIYVRGGNRADLPALAPREPGLATDTQEFFVGTPKGNISFPNRTLAPITLYMSTTGNDANDGSSGSPLKSWQAVRNRIPQNVDHAVTINLIAGTYADNISLSGITGKGSITINGGSSYTDAANFTVNSINIATCMIPISVNGIRTTLAEVGFYFARCSDVLVNMCRSEAAVLGGNGFGFVATNAQIVTSGAVNRNYVVLTDSNSLVCSRDWGSTGGGSNYGLYASYGSVIAKNGGQPVGTVANELTGAGGLIR